MQFGKHMYDPELQKNYEPTPFEESVAAVGELLESGKIKQWGLSNENAYGVTMMCETAKRLGVPLPVSIQNDYSITDRYGSVHQLPCQASCSKGLQNNTYLALTID